MSTGRQTAARALLVVGGLLTGLLLAEGAARLTGLDRVPMERRRDVLVAPDGGRIGPQRDTASQLPPHSIVVTTYGSDPRGSFGPGATVEHRQNALGYRDGDHTVDKPADTLRIVGLGDSFLWGQGVGREALVLRQLEQRLRPADGRRVETLNRAFSGAEGMAQLAMLERDGLPYDPDLVLLFFVLNDVQSRDSARISFEAAPLDQLREPRDRLGRYSHAWAWARQRWTLRRVSAAYLARNLAAFHGDDPDWLIARRLVERMSRTCQEASVPFVFVLWPYLVGLSGDSDLDPVYDIIVSQVSELGIEVVDLREAYRGHDGPELWVHPTDQHPNEEAHRLAAAHLAEVLGSHPALE